MLGRGYGAV